MPNRRGKKGHPYLIPNLGREAFSSLTLSMTLAVGFSQMIIS